MPRMLVVAVVGSLVLLLNACGTASPTNSAGLSGGDSQPTIVVTTSVWADVVSNVACDDLAAIRTLMPAGSDPHSFEPSLADRASMDSAVLIVANGLGLEAGLIDTIDSAQDDGTAVFRVAEHVETIRYATASDHDHGGGGGGGGDHDDDQDDQDDQDHAQDRFGQDPHVWFDPTRVAAVLAPLGDQLVTRAGLDAEKVAQCVARYTDRLQALDADIVQMTSALPADDRKLVTNHDALGYFADRYDFEVIGTVIPTPSGLAETNPAHLQELTVLIEEAGVPAIFAEAQQADDDAAALAAQVGGVEVVTLSTGSLGQPGSASDTYIGFMETNATLIAESLGNR